MTQTETDVAERPTKAVNPKGCVKDLPSDLYHRTVLECMHKALKGWTLADARQKLNKCSYSIYSLEDLRCLRNRMNDFHPAFVKDVLEDLNCAYISRATLSVESGEEDGNLKSDIVVFNSSEGEIYVTINHHDEDPFLAEPEDL